MPLPRPKAPHDMYGDFRTIIKKWPGGPTGCAEDANVSIKLVYSWISRNNSPAAYWNRLVEGSKKRGFLVVNLKLLATLAESKHLNFDG